MTEVIMKTNEKQEVEEFTELVKRLDPGAQRELMGMIRGMQMALDLRGGSGTNPDPEERKTA